MAINKSDVSMLSHNVIDRGTVPINFLRLFSVIDSKLKWNLRFPLVRRST